MEAVESKSFGDFERLVREHQAGLRAFVRALGVDDAWVDDLSQEVFIIAFQRLTDFEVGTDFGRWLRSIARNLAANERRKEARRSRLLPAVMADVLLRHDAEGDFEFNLNVLVSVMNDCVAELPPRSQKLLRRRYAGGETALTLAAELGVKAEALRQTLLRIRLAVKECIERRRGDVWQ